MLDWEVELLYTMTKQSVDVLSQDPQQLATEIINWLTPFTSKNNGNGGPTHALDRLVQDAHEWCDRGHMPLLVPQNSWLTLTLPPQVTVVTCLSPISHAVATPDCQHVFCTARETDIEMHNLPSKTRVGLLQAHEARITCLHLTISGRWLISGSKDSEMIIWDVSTGTVSCRFRPHNSGVQCVTSVRAETLIISGSDSGEVAVSRLENGQLVKKLENHRGVVSSVAVNSGDDIFASASTDRCVCVWSLEDLSLLNTLHLGSPVTQLEISADSTFLLVSCADHSVHVRSLATGSDVHCLYYGSPPASALCFAGDSCRAALGCRDGRVRLFDVHSARPLRDPLPPTHADHPVVSVQALDNDRFLMTAGGNKIVVWNFYCRRLELLPPKARTRGKDDKHHEPVTCVAVSRDGAIAVSGSRDHLVKVWQLCSGEVHATLRGHGAAVTCVILAPNGLFAVSGAEDAQLRVWGLTLGLLVSTFQEHGSRITAVNVTSDSRRVLSVESRGIHRLWEADTGIPLVMCNKPAYLVQLHANMVFAVGGKNDCSLKFWPVTEMENEKSVSHSDAITCYTVTYDCQTIVTGSNDMSLKVWEVGSGKLTQVLVGHESPVTCCACAPLSPSLVVSGSSDCNLIVWDLTTGEDNFTLRGHTESITHAKLTLDGTLAISASSDNTLGIWNTTTGSRVGLLGVHGSILGLSGALSLSRVVLQLANQSVLPFLRLLNNPTKNMALDLPPGTPIIEEVKTPGHSWRGVVPQRVLLRGNLKREQSFDSFYWDLRSASPNKHSDLGLSLEDFRRVPSPFGSREHLWDGRLIQPKAKIPKHKILKKQQSMFACFPEFVTQATSPQQPTVTKRSLSRAASLEETGDRSDEQPNNAAVKQSSVCSVS